MSGSRAYAPPRVRMSGRTLAVAGMALAIAVSAVAAVAAVVAAADFQASLDFIALYAAARLVLEGRGADVLDPAAILAAEHAAAPERAALLPFVHPPVVALVYAPLAALPFSLAHWLVVAIDVGCLAAAAYLLRGMVEREARPALFTLALLAPSSVVAALNGQTSPLLLLALAASLRAPPFWSGVLVGLAALRPQTAPLLLLAALSGPRRAAGAATSVGLLVAASIGVVGLGGVPRYAATLLDASRWTVTGELGLSGAIGWSGFGLWLGVPLLGVALMLVSLAVGAVRVWHARGWEARLVEAMPWALLASPHALVHDAVIAYPAFAARVRGFAPLAASSIAGVLISLLQFARVALAPFWLLALAFSRPRS